MPFQIAKVPGGYMVKNLTTDKVHAKKTTFKKAEAQVRLLRAIEHGLVPRKK